MTTTDTPTLDQALAVAQRLSRADRAALIARLALDLGAEGASAASTAANGGDRSAVVAAVSEAGPHTGDDLEDELDQLVAEAAALGPAAADSADIISAMRR